MFAGVGEMSVAYFLLFITCFDAALFWGVFFFSLDPW